MVDKVKKALLKEKYKDERVFVLPSTDVTTIPDLFTRDQGDGSFKFNQYDDKGTFIYRYDAEGDGAFQQIIPYVLIYNPKTKKFFVSLRTKQSGEQRLYDKISLGFGGHINPCDGPSNIIWNALVRELKEEVDMDQSATFYYKGTIRNITSELNDHLGFVFVAETEQASIKETDKLIGQWMSVQELIDNYFKLEDWAKFIVDYMYAHNNEL